MISLDPVQQQSNLKFWKRDVDCVRLCFHDLRVYVAVQSVSEMYNRSIVGVNITLFYCGFWKKIKLYITLYVY